MRGFLRRQTLLRLIVGEIEQDEGTLSAGGLTIGYLRQETQEQETEHTVLDEAIQAFEQVIALEEKEHQLVSKIDAFGNHDSLEYNTLLVELEGCAWPGLSRVAGASYEWKVENPEDGLRLPYLYPLTVMDQTNRN